MYHLKNILLEEREEDSELTKDIKQVFLNTWIQSTAIFPYKIYVHF